MPQGIKDKIYLCNQYLCLVDILIDEEVSKVAEAYTFGF